MYTNDYTRNGKWMSIGWVWDCGLGIADFGLWIAD
jgi:hypothetical protein